MNSPFAAAIAAAAGASPMACGSVPVTLDRKLLVDGDGLAYYCGGNDETPQDHCMDCQRPGNVPVCSSCGGAGCVDCATDGVKGGE